MSASPPKDRFLALLAQALEDGTFVKVTLGAYRGPDRSLQQLLVRSIDLRGAPHLSLIWRQSTRDVTRNYPRAEGLALLAEVIGADFRTAHLFTTQRSLQLEFRAGKGSHLREGPAAHATPPPAAHDTPKARRLTAAGSPWLRSLGVTTPEGKVARGMEAKFRQLEQFLEVLDPLLARAGLSPAPPETPVQVVDMGCGKGYLTFAIHDWLARGGSRPDVLGLEARPELAELTNRIAQEHHCQGLRFAAGTIADAPLGRVDILLALHACDTATDDALARGIAAGARLILVSPCCHKEVRPQLQPPPPLADALRHGILLERQAEFVTDALRAALLEWAGYDTRVFEFISTEHTAKNLMIAAVKRPGPARGEAEARRVQELAAFYGVRTQHLARQLGVPLAPPPPPAPAP
ncbi:MAG: hypothetical protein RJA22_466 [Verrucomicrobiota bacterium]